MESTIYTVKEFNNLVNTVMSQVVGEVTITGEISGFQIRQNKWVSFDLKDEESCINCFTTVRELDLPLEDGQEVVVTGAPRIYVPYGKYSFTVRQIQLKGEGALQRAFELLKRKLEAEGLFDPRYKKPLPAFPQTIGIITSKEGAAINDIKKVIAGRMGGLTLYLAPVLVQGKNAPDELVGALNYFNAYQPVDVIIFGRGGGSLEDLQAFNSEKVARAIFASKTPIISGIGHEHNTSIADLVADKRAATPSNAAELCIPDREALRQRINYLIQTMEDTVERQVVDYKNRITILFRLLPQLIEKKTVYVRSLVQQFARCLDASQKSLVRTGEQLQRLQDKLWLDLASLHTKQKTRLQNFYSLLAVLDPKQVLERGYTITYNAATNKPITKRALVPLTGKIRTQFHDGVVVSTLANYKAQILTLSQSKQAQLFSEEPL